MAGAGGLRSADSSASTARRRQLLGCLAAVASIHLALLGDWRRPVPVVGSSADTASAARTGTPSPQQKPWSERPRTTVVALRQAAARDPDRSSTPAPIEAVTAVSAPLIAEPPRAVGPTETTAPVTSVAPDTPPAADEDQAFDGSLYLPRSALTEGASALDMVDLPYPDSAPAGHFRAELTLYIDQSGTVRRVRVEQGALPAVLEDAARQAFLRARFAPGSIHGVAVRSRMRIEVEFGADPRVATPHGAP